MKQVLILAISAILLSSCITAKHGRYLIPYLDARLESKHFVDSLKRNGIDTILLYHKKHGYSREYFILWLENSVLQIRNISSTGIIQIGDWQSNALYRNKRLFEFYVANKNRIDTDRLENVRTIIKGADTFRISFSHYPYVDIAVTLGQETKTYHLPYGISSSLDNSVFHFARLIESTIYNLGHNTSWKEAEKKYKYYPRNYDPNKKRWRKWQQKKERNGDIWEDFYH